MSPRRNRDGACKFFTSKFPLHRLMISQVTCRLGAASTAQILVCQWQQMESLSLWWVPRSSLCFFNVCLHTWTLINLFVWSANNCFGGALFGTLSRSMRVAHPIWGCPSEVGIPERSEDWSQAMRISESPRSPWHEQDSQRPVGWILDEPDVFTCQIPWRASAQGKRRCRDQHRRERWQGRARGPTHAILSWG